MALFRYLIAGDAPNGREATIDVIRGICIVSMVFAHIALGGIGYKITHAAIWYDGAMGFVLLSGLVVGLVQRKTVERGGQRAGTVKAWKRARLVYIAHITICVLAFVLAGTTLSGSATFASVSSVGGWWQSLLATLTLQINPPRAAILSLYVVLLLFTPLASLLMRRNLWWALAGLSALAFMAGHAWEQLATLPRQPGEFGEINVATWQLMYFLAFIAGWNWKTVREWLDKRSVWIIAAIVTVGIVFYARRTPWDQYPDAVLWVFGSGQMGPGTILLAFAIIVTMFPVLTWIDKRLPTVTGVIARVGRRSLDNYIILAFIVLPIQVLLPYDSSAPLSDLGAVVALIVMWVWSRLRDHRSSSTALTTTPVAKSG